MRRQAWIVHRQLGRDLRDLRCGLAGGLDGHIRAYSAADGLHPLGLRHDRYYRDLQRCTRQGRRERQPQSGNQLPACSFTNSGYSWRTPVRPLPLELPAAQGPAGPPARCRPPLPACPQAFPAREQEDRRQHNPRDKMAVKPHREAAYLVVIVPPSARRSATARQARGAASVGLLPDFEWGCGQWSGMATTSLRGGVLKNVRQSRPTLKPKPIG